MKVCVIDKFGDDNSQRGRFIQIDIDSNDRADERDSVASIELRQTAAKPADVVAQIDDRVHAFAEQMVEDLREAHHP
jgi:hypothetical protein